MSKHLDWITDPHLDHLQDQEMLVSFVKRLYARDSDGLIITGDIAESATTYKFLDLIVAAYQRPVYFVLGNHDYYGAWMKDTHASIQRVCSEMPVGTLNWMSDIDALMLDENTAIVGHDGFYDGQEGAVGLTTFALNDFLLPLGILDLVAAFKEGTPQLFEKMYELGNLSAEHIRKQIHSAAQQGARRVLVLTHVPPFLEVSYFRGRPSEARAAPFYVNRVLGQTLLELAHEMPHLQIEVFAGHTHGKCEYQPCDNLLVRVGNARYGCLPTFQRKIEF